MSVIFFIIILFFWLIKVRPFLKKKGIKNYVGANPLQMLFADWSELARVARDSNCKEAKRILNTMNLLTVVSVILLIVQISI